MILFRGNLEKTDPSTWAQNLGGKGKNLLKLQTLGFKVPEWIAIPSSTLLQLADDASKISSFKFPDVFRFELERVLNETGLIEKKLAVRSSASLEDGTQHSFAGIYKTVLNVEKDRLLDEIRNVWLSLYSDTVNQYLHSKTIDRKNLSMAIVIQEMVPADAAGVGFGVNPLNQKRDQRVIEAVHGLGEGLVSGELDSDQFIVRKRRVISSRRASTVPAITEKQAIEISNILEQLESKLGAPQDIEFAIYAQEIWLLQTRPITTLLMNTPTLWDNNNIIESYPGTTTPLTFSFVRKTYRMGYRQLSEMIGISKRIIDKNDHHYSNMIGLIKNRMYYNLSSIAEIIRILPGAMRFQYFFENAIGIESNAHERRTMGRRGNELQRRKSDFQLFIVGLRTIGLLVVLPWSRRRFLMRLNAILKEEKERSLSTLTAQELIELYRSLEKNVFAIWRAPVVNGFFTMIVFGVLKKLTVRWELNSDAPNIHNDLLVGQDDIISTEPIRKIIALTELIRSEPTSLRLFQSENPQEIWDALQNGPSLSNLREEISRYLSAYGDRCIGGELKLETPSYSQAPQNFIKILKSYIQQEVKLSFGENKNAQIRIKAEAVLREHFIGHPFRYAIYSAVLALSRNLISWRENLRFSRSQAFGLVKAIFVQLGDRLKNDGVIEASRDVFFLTQEEIFDFYENRQGAQVLREKAEVRRKEFEKNSQVSMPQRIRTYPNSDRIEKVEIASTSDIGAKTVLKGIGCSSGIVRGRVRIIRSPEEAENMNGDILATESTDPGWIKLFPTASAIVLERGSLLSHAGIVTREMGIPCVVGVKGLLSYIKDNDLIELDGSTGEVRILTENEKKND